MNNSEYPTYACLSREVNMMYDLAPESRRRKQPAWRAFKRIEDVVKRTKNTQFHAHIFDSTIVPVLTYASETGSPCKQSEGITCIIDVERSMLRESRILQMRKTI